MFYFLKLIRTLLHSVFSFSNISQFHTFLFEFSFFFISAIDVLDFITIMPRRTSHLGRRQMCAILLPPGVNQVCAVLLPPGVNQICAVLLTLATDC
jgi:hypothetical protein